MPDSPASLALSIVLHDVTPESWPLYQKFVAAADSIGRVPLTLLVVPEFHGKLHLDRFPDFRNAIEKRLARGDEVVLHGYYHHDDSPLRRNPKELFMRRVYTHEGEFYSLDESEAGKRLERGMELFRRYRWPVAGFVAPAWLMSNGTQAALRNFPLSYTSDPVGLICLPEWRRIEAPTLVWSSRSAWRRRASRQWNQFLMRQSTSKPLLRLGLHPIDMQYREVVTFWLAALDGLLAARIPQTKARWVDAHRT